MDIQAQPAPTVRNITVPPSPDDFRNELDFTQGFDPFMNWDSGVPWTKFTVLTAEPDKVYFQNANLRVFHYDFAHGFLPPFKNMTPAQFDEATMGAPGQVRQAVLGAVQTGNSKDGTKTEFGLQLIGSEPFDLATVIKMLSAAKQQLKIANPAQTKFFYFPTAEQALAAAGYAHELEAAGFPISGPERWSTGDQVYAPGWALGRLRFVPHEKIDEQYASGELKPTDILLTDQVPAEVPNLAGVIGLMPGYANSHVAILSQTLGAPYAFPQDEAAREKLLTLEGKTVMFQALGNAVGGQVTVRDVGQISPAMFDDIAALKVAEPLDVTPKKKLGKVGVMVDELGPNDVALVGGKAANYAVLKKALPVDVVSPAAALSFDVWDSFREQKVESTRTPGTQVTLDQEITDRLALARQTIDGQDRPASYPPPDMLRLKAALDGIRALIVATPLGAALEGEIANTLQGPSGAPRFDATRALRFRSSTNMEDLKNFTGAGMYESFTGTLGIDLGTVPPRGNRRGAFEAIRRTMASFYNDNAYLERLRRKVDESKVGMAMLVHYSVPDRTELGNGVATIELSDSGYQARLVSQRGSESVTNPEPGAPRPEVVSVYGSVDGSQEPFVGLEQLSGRVRIGEYVLEFPGDYQKLGEHMRVAAQAFVEARGLTLPATLDLEFKKLNDTNPPHLSIKQIRPVPKIEGVVPTVVLAEQATLETSQGEGGNVLSNHLAKSRWQVKTRDAWLSGPRMNPANGIFESVSVDYVDDGQVKHFEGPLGSFEAYKHTRTTGAGSSAQIQEKWNGPLGAQPPGSTPDNALVTSLNTEHRIEEGPLTLLGDHRVQWDVDLKGQYSAPDPSAAQVVNKQHPKATVLLQQPREPEEHVQDQRSFVAQGVGRNGADVKIVPTYRYAKPSHNVFQDKTARLGEWNKTTIEGLTSQPIELTSFFSQTMNPGHHNFWEEFIFQPSLEELVPAATRAELLEKDIELIYVHTEHPDRIFVAGRDRKWRRL
jgi:hypothetical protein